MAIREGAWDCPHCGRKRNRGPEKYCGGCGAPRGEDVPFYLPEDARVVADEAELQRAKAGPDWTCNFCEADNPSTNAFCSSCGASKDGAPARPVVEHRTDAAPAPPPQPLQAAPPPPGKQRVLTRGCGIGCLGLVLLVLFFGWLGRPREKTLTVAGFGWERAVEVEEMRTVQEEGWQDALPAGARSLSSSREIRRYNKVQIGTETKTRTVTERVQTGTERVKVGERDLGNGYFEDIYEDRPVYEEQSREETYEEPVYREDPVYGVKVRYEVDKWVKVRDAKLAGDDRSPRWPEPELRVNERMGKRAESYVVRLVGPDGKSYTYKPPNETDWRSFEPGREYKAMVRRSGEIERILGPA